MATVTRVVVATPQQVFAVLADGWSYSNWVTGTSHMRAVDTTWPAVGSKVFHATGAWPVVIRDETVVEQLDRDRRMVLLARGRPFGQARVVITLTAEPAEPGEPAGTRVVMSETPVAGPGKWLDNPLLQAALTRRNVESLARLAAIAERSTHPATGGCPPASTPRTNPITQDPDAPETRPHGASARGVCG